MIDVAELGELATLIKRHRYFWANEYELQDSLEKVLKQAGLEPRREHRLSDTGDRLDFYLPARRGFDRIAIEVKVGGSLTNVIRQLARYAKSEAVDGILLVTAVARLTQVPPEILGKPVKVASLLGDLL